MSNYCDSADLLKVKTTTELAQLADLDGDGSADSDVITRACTNATQIINSYISPRYALPLSGNALETAKTIAVRLAIYYLHLDRDSLTEDINKQYDRDLAFLRDIQQGKASLGDPDDASDGDVSPGISFGGDDREFTRTKMENW